MGLTLRLVLLFQCPNSMQWMLIVPENQKFIFQSFFLNSLDTKDLLYISFVIVEIMDFSSTWFFLVPLLATFSTGLPSPVEEDKAKPEDSGSNIYNINITIHCYFHSDSPECKDNPKEAADVRPSNDIDDGDTSNSSSENTVQEDGVNLEEASKIRDMYHMPPKEYKARVEEALPSQYETSSENNSYKDLESYSKLWQGRRITRDELCTSCLAIASDENFILDSSQQFGFRRKMIHKDGQQFVAVKTQLVRVLVLLCF